MFVNKYLQKYIFLDKMNEIYKIFKVYYLDFN